MKDIALTGLSRSGKDSVAARLVEAYGYVRVAFADTLKEAALKANPYIPVDEYGADWDRLSDVVSLHGWEMAKDAFPEVRRFLQYYGQTVREIDPEFWIRAAWPAAVRAKRARRPVVFTDVRYVNEADMLRRNGFRIVRVVRPGQVPGDHPSEREMLAYPVDETIVNDNTLAVLAVKAGGLALL
ncbi:deoxynucleotide monophosphate kinase family protein [Streptomyces cylindrosporus]|uniref:DNMP kinase n=1 Tax=Streptomyces cylindrosporus TaxID=2927583 RepID=A0ABS9Y1Z4_9ACTN|nr:hypothetical protein [Streptomyces cylindrosporus]MCI3271034.1 hypothetical protein [Streptomyces cylindrosporus]